MTATDATALVPLSDLYLHALNTRSEPPPQEIAALADSIEELGLLQNLAGYADPSGRQNSHPFEPGAAGIGIVAGGRRLRAMMLLAQRNGRDPTSTMVPVRITTDEDTARLWASAENAARLPLHPADEVRAYARMTARGADPATIAKAFAVTARHVNQRLALANLPAPALDALRNNLITLDQAGALTSAESEAALLTELRRVLSSTWNIDADSIRRNLRPAGITLRDRRVIWMGLDAYRDAGGRVQEDLFSAEVRLLDEPILNDLFLRRLDEAAGAERARGWLWVEVATDSYVPYEKHQRLEPVHPTPVDLPEADAQELEDLSEIEDPTEEQADRIAELEEREAGGLSDEDIATSGVWVFVDPKGNLSIKGPYRNPQDRAAVEDIAAEEPGEPTAKPVALSHSLAGDLSRIRLAALQAECAQSPELMLDLLAWQLSCQMKPWATPLAINASEQPIEPEKADGWECPAALTADEPEEAAEATPAAFADFRALGRQHRNKVLARGLARALVGRLDLCTDLASRLEPEPRDHWTPTAEGYFARLPVPVMDAIWAELGPNSASSTHEAVRDAALFPAAKKAIKANYLEKLFGDASYRETLGLSKPQIAALDAWLPAELRWPGVAAGGDTDGQEAA